MKNLQSLCAAVALLFVLSVSVLAGNIHTDFVPPPPPPASAMAAGPIESTSVVTTTVESDSLVTEITLTLLQLLSVF